ncbi:hypothetical protein AAF712_015388 [Marasmius tenuissimus]|uniref:Uncharacterized protein n=1 Tax=Marasmius tenuissimus TaxID=585030 RepID=A0ABR2ZAY7_9AGAR
MSISESDLFRIPRSLPREADEILTRGHECDPHQNPADRSHPHSFSPANFYYHERMKSQSPTCKKTNKAEGIVQREMACGSGGNGRNKRNGGEGKDALNGSRVMRTWSEGPGTFEVDFESGDEDDDDDESDDDEADDGESDGDSDESEDESERDPNDNVFKRAITITPALQQQFSRLLNRHCAEPEVFEWKKRNKERKCERCITYALPCTSNLGDRKLICQECNRTRERRCSRVNDMRKESIMKKMGIDEDLWERLKKVHLEDKSRRTIQRRKEKTRRMEKAVQQETEEEDELDSDYEDVPQRAVTSTTTDLGTYGKRKRTPVDDEGALSRSSSRPPPAKKGKTKPEVVIEVILNKTKSGYRECLRPARNKNIKPSELSNEVNKDCGEKILNEVPGDIEPALAADVVRGTKRPRRPTEDADNVGVGQRKRSRDAEKGIISDLDTHGRSGPTDHPTTTPSTSTSLALLQPHSTTVDRKPTAEGFMASDKATTSGSPSLTRNAVHRPPLTAPPLEPSSTEPNQIHNVAKLSQLPPSRCFPPTGQAGESPAVPPPRSIPPELSLSVLKRALEDISSDLRYDRIDVPTAMVKFDEVAERIGRRASLCVVPSKAAT